MRNFWGAKSGPLTHAWAVKVWNNICRAQKSGYRILFPNSKLFSLIFNNFYISYPSSIFTDFIYDFTRSEPNPNPIRTWAEPNLNPIWNQSRPKYINLAKWVTKRNVTRYLVAFWEKIIIKCLIHQFWLQMYTLVMLYRAPKLQDFHRVLSDLDLDIPKNANSGIFGKN